VNVDFKSWAQKRDLDETMGHAPKKQLPPLQFPKLPKGFKPIQLFGEDGGVLEDKNGVPLILIITKIFERIEELEASNSQSELTIVIHTFIHCRRRWSKVA
jgi:hypothetical protein